MSESINQLVSGTMVTSYLVAATFFMRFWKSTRDRLFWMFGIAFCLLGIQRLALALAGEVSENTTYLYMVRLVAFVLILVAIIDKNRVKKA
jgi:hypothetical protein